MILLYSLFLIIIVYLMLDVYIRKKTYDYYVIISKYPLHKWYDINVDPIPDDIKRIIIIKNGFTTLAQTSDICFNKQGDPVVWGDKIRYWMPLPLKPLR